MESTIARIVAEDERLAVLAMRYYLHGVKHVMRFDGFDFAARARAIREPAADFLLLCIPLMIEHLLFFFIQAFCYSGGSGLVGVGTARGVFDVKAAQLFLVSGDQAVQK